MTTDTTNTEALSTEIPKGYWQDARGTLTHVSKIKDVDKARDRVVRKMVADAQEASKFITAFKQASNNDLEAFLELSANEYGKTMRGLKGKGNISLVSYDGKFKVERAISERIAFDERLQLAKQVVDECIHRFGKGVNHNFKAIAARAFKADKAGNVSAARILDLRGIDIDDEEWKRAMDIIADSMQVVGSKPYLRFYVRDDQSGKYIAIPLDVANA